MIGKEQMEGQTGKIIIGCVSNDTFSISFDCPSSLSGASSQPMVGEDWSSLGDIRLLV